MDRKDSFVIKVVFPIKLCALLIVPWYTPFLILYMTSIGGKFYFSP